MGMFLTDNNDPTAQHSEEYYRLYRQAIFEIANGLDLWAEGGIEAIIHFINYVKENWFIVSINTQLVER